MARPFATSFRCAECGDLGAGDFWNFPTCDLRDSGGLANSLDLHAHGVQPEDVRADEPDSTGDDVYVLDSDDFVAGEDFVEAGFHDQVRVGDALVFGVRAWCVSFLRFLG